MKVIVHGSSGPLGWLAYVRVIAVCAHEAKEECVFVCVVTVDELGLMKTLWTSCRAEEV